MSTYIKKPAKESAIIRDLLSQLEMAWAIMSNSSNWDDGKGSPGWKQAAERWRDDYFMTYNRLKGYDGRKDSEAVEE